MQSSKEVDIHKEIDPYIVVFEDLNNALIGYCDIFNKTIAIYDKKKVIKLLMDKNNWTEEDSEEYYEYNIVGCYLGDLTPGFISYI